jgi:hypothetical protein
MRKIFFLLFLFPLSLNGFGQKKILNGFFERIGFNSFLYFDDVKNTNPLNWKSLTGNNRPIPIQFEILMEIERIWDFNISGGAGLTVRLEKNISKNLNGTWINNLLEWRAGLGYKRFKMSEQFSTYYSFPSDTTKIYRNDLFSAEFTQHFADIQNTIIYKFPPHKKKVGYFFIGAGIQNSFSIANKLEEKSSSGQLKWNTPARRWQSDTSLSFEGSYPVKNNVHNYLLVPAGIEIHFSDYFQLQTDITYSLHLKNQQLPSQGSSSGAMFCFTMRFKL